MANKEGIDRVACILAAGTGSRLKSYTKDNTKCMISIGNQRLIDRILSQIEAACFSKVVIVVGYGAKSLENHIRKNFSSMPLCFINNVAYATTNNIYSLQMAVPELSSYGEVVIFESDVWIDDNEAINFLTNKGLTNHALVSPYEYWMDGTCALIDIDGAISTFVSKRDIHRYNSSELYKTANWYRFDGEYFNRFYTPFINAYISANGKNAYYEDVLKVIVPFSPVKIYSHSIPSERWMDIDDEEDLRRANIIAQTNPREMAKGLRDQFGGYWKNTAYEDLTLLENPYFPPDEFWKEFLEVVPIAGRSYPSKQSVISNLYAKSANVESRHVAVGNGAAELMMTLFNTNKESYTIVAPYFLEYHRLLSGRLNIIDRDFPNVELWDALSVWRANPNGNLILISPNNPTGEYLTSDQILSLVQIGAINKCKILLDESFCDFSSSQNSLLTAEILDAHSNLIILKSLGKSYGIGGVRLGVLCSSDDQTIQDIRNSLPIWNVSSFAEVFLDILPKYKTQFNESIRRLMLQRQYFESELKESNIWFYPTNTNFVLLRVKNGFENMVDEAFFNNGLLIKSINRASMSGAYLRIALKSMETTRKVLSVIKENKPFFDSFYN